MKAMQEQANLLKAEELLKKMGFKGSLLQPAAGSTVEAASVDSGHASASNRMDG